MNKHELARRMAVTANALITISLFLVLLWWRASLILFTTCWVLYTLAWWIEGSVQEEGHSRTASGPFVAPRLRL